MEEFPLGSLHDHEHLIKSCRGSLGFGHSLGLYLPANLCYCRLESILIKLHVGVKY